MGLATDLGYSVGAANSFQRVMAAIGSTRPASFASNKLIRPMDRAMLRFSGGRSSATAWLIGLHPIWLTTIGARTGQARTVPLFGIPIEDDLGLLGTSFGQHSTPAWVHNLEANPSGRVAFRDVELETRARHAGPDEAIAIWAAAAGIYRGYPNYAAWAGHRDIRVFVLEREERA